MAYPEVDSSDVLECLEKILRQPEFSASPRLSAFLRFVVEETLAGRGSRLKAFTIATSVLGRDDTFDPQSNPIVRVEALRLRRMLDQYYAGAGISDRLEIRIRRGSYVPDFVHRMAPTPAVTALIDEPEPEVEQPIAEVAPAIARSGTWLTRGAAAIATIVVICLGIVLLNTRPVGRTPGTQQTAFGYWPATLRVGPFEALGDQQVLGPVAGRLADRVEDALSRFDNPVVLHDPAGDMQPDYRITATLSLQAPDVVSANFRMVHRASGEIIWTRRVDGIPLDVAVNNAAADTVAQSIGQTYGVVFSDMRKRLPSSSADLGGYGCVIYAYGVLELPSAPGLQGAIDCLNRTLGVTPEFAPAYAARATLDVLAYLDGIGTEPDADLLERSRGDASRAVALAPTKGRMHLALFWSRFYNDHFNDAFDEAATAIDLNPNAAETLGRIGAAHMARGDFAMGRELIERGFHTSPVQPGWLEFYRVLDAWNSNDLERARRHAARHAAGNFALGIISRAMMAGVDGDQALGARCAEELAASYPRVAADIPATLDRYRFTPDLRDRILALLDRAGVPRIRLTSN